MLRSLQSATLSFGLVNVPVRLYTAAKSRAVSFHWLSPQGHRVKQRLYSASGAEEGNPPGEDAGEFSEMVRETPRPESPLKENTQGEYAPTASPVSTGQEVDRESLLKGYEVSRNQYVTLSPEELKALEDATNQHAEIQEFVPLDTVDPVFFERTYYLGPDKGGEKPYWLLGRALRDSNCGAVAKLVMRGKEKIVFIRPTDENRLILEVLYWGDEVRDFSEVNIPEMALKDQEVSLAGKLIESLSSEQWNPHKYHDTYRERVLELIQKKQQGQEIVAPQPRSTGEVLDLMEALKRSLQKGEGKKKAPARSHGKLRRTSVVNERRHK